MHGGAQGGSFGSGKADDRNPEDICADLAPDPAFAASSSQPDLGWLNSKGAESIQPVSQSQGRSLHGGSGEVGGSHIGGGEAVKDTDAVRKIRRAFTDEIRQKNDPSRAWRRPGNVGL